jgi:hypothetical protein
VILVILSSLLQRKQPNLLGEEAGDDRKHSNSAVRVAMNR